ncbi:DUF1573 domain-containing protein [Opitutia bacterium ISCC 51]|nr:DUF1573 domain-containing protein [Opitutae bacterium ISCC 51]QXD29028.1 DUF1573 domain-containing protein [Opitutae bacterium ISCC 52]
MKIFFLTLLLCLTLPFLATAKLQFEHERIVHEANLDETEYTAKFKFTNRGDKAITVKEVHSSCGCTTALPSKRLFEPGESGEISATFDYGQREGKQIKSIRVETDQEEESRIVLTLEVNIPSVMEVSPSVVMWNRSVDSEFKAKEVIIESHLNEPIEITEVIGSSDLFVQEVRVIEEGKKFALAVSPQNIPTDKKGILRGTFVIKTNFANPAKGTLKIYALVR